MTKQYSFNQDQMNGIVEEIYATIIKECKKFKVEKNCPDEQIISFSRVIASNISPIVENKNNYNE